MIKRLSLSVLAGLATLVASPALASFHLMKIEQVIGGVGGDTTQQAIQLRMRANGQNFLNNQGRLVVRDAAGANPVTLISFGADAATGLLGRRVLIVSPAFAAAQTGIDEDFVMTSTIPASYLAAGRLTFENTTGTVLWSLAWGGAGYTGPHTGATFNDADGNFGPAFGSALPSSGTQALLFTAADPTGAALSMTNLADYGITAGAATFTNNANQSGTVVGGTPTAIRFYPLTPCRVADTRGAAGPSGGPALAANASRDFPVTTICSVPADAQAVAVTLTVTAATEAGNLRLYPAGTGLPTASTINFVAAKARANNAIVKLGTGGAVSVRCDMSPGSSGTTHFLFDVTGYLK
ncbi:MAG TPA: hypothetical protein VF310_08155 [Vicinamibacteria bacterium]